MGGTSTPFNTFPYGGGHIPPSSPSLSGTHQQSVRTLTLIYMDISSHPPFRIGSKHFSNNFDNLLFLAVLTSEAILSA
jgi:hypothetical protein